MNEEATEKENAMAPGPSQATLTVLKHVLGVFGAEAGELLRSDPEFSLGDFAYDGMELLDFLEDRSVDGLYQASLLAGVMFALIEEKKPESEPEQI